VVELFFIVLTFTFFLCCSVCLSSDYIFPQYCSMCLSSDYIFPQYCFVCLSSDYIFPLLFCVPQFRLHFSSVLFCVPQFRSLLFVYSFLWHAKLSLIFKFSVPCIFYKLTINVSNRCDLFYIFISYIFSLSPYMFRAFLGPSSGVS
jgi:hypothetical protein